MLTRMTDEDWATVLEVFRACRSRRGAKGRDDRKFLEALHYFSVHNITWRALPEAFGNWNSVWKRFCGQAGVFEAFFDALAASSRSCSRSCTRSCHRRVTAGSVRSPWLRLHQIWTIRPKHREAIVSRISPGRRNTSGLPLLQDNPSPIVPLSGREDTMSPDLPVPVLAGEVRPARPVRAAHPGPGRHRPQPDRHVGGVLRKPAHPARRCRPSRALPR